jgi:hypothetical protein
MLDNQQLAQAAPALSRTKHEVVSRHQQGKLRQAAKIKELEKVLLTLGYKSAGQRAAVLGLKRSTVWAIFHAEHTRGGLSSNIVKQMLAAKAAPKELKQVVAEYVRGKLSGAYGHNHSELKRFRIRAGLPGDTIDPATTDRIPLAPMRLI